MSAYVDPDAWKTMRITRRSWKNLMKETGGAAPSPRQVRNQLGRQIARPNHEDESAIAQLARYYVFKFEQSVAEVLRAHLVACPSPCDSEIPFVTYVDDRVVHCDDCGVDHPVVMFQPNPPIPGYLRVWCRGCGRGWSFVQLWMNKEAERLPPAPPPRYPPPRDPTAGAPS